MMPVRVLVVDDDDLSREVLSLMLQGCGYEVETAESGDAALLHLQASATLPRVVLTDLQMQGTSGKELAQRLRTLCGSSTMLLAMSASEPEDRSDLAFDNFLLKPFAMEAFTAAIDGVASTAVNGSDNIEAAVLNEAVYRKLAASMPRSQLEKLYQLCLADAETRLAAMRHAASHTDDASYKREAHAIKGSCGMVGATELQTLATSMEMRGLSDDHIATLNEFVLACQRLRGMLVAHETTHRRASGMSGEDA